MKPTPLKGTETMRATVSHAGELLTMADYARAREVGYHDGYEAACESGSAEQPADGWDGNAINAVGKSAFLAELGLDAATEPETGWSDAARALLLAYVRGAKQGAAAAVEDRSLFQAADTVIHRFAADQLDEIGPAPYLAFGIPNA